MSNRLCIDHLLTFPRLTPALLAAGAGAALAAALSAQAERPTTVTTDPAAKAAEPQRLDDAEIEAAIERELLLDGAVPSMRLRVSCDDGIVTLRGVCADLLADERAVAIARTVRGVRGVIDRIKVRPSVDQTPAELATSIKAALAADPATESFEVVVKTDEQGAVTLSGTVESWAERALCATVTRGVAGVTSVDNAIVCEPTGERSDAQIRSEVAQRLHWDVWIDDHGIEVACENGVVMLAGGVGSASERYRAERAAHIAGVRDVQVDELEVLPALDDDTTRPSPNAVRSPEQIVEAVRASFDRDPRLREAELDVAVDDLHDVVLTGTVDNLRARRAAADDARNTLGVVHVQNRIRVDPGREHEHEALVGAIEAAFVRDAMVDADQVEVTVQNGIAHLYGAVDTVYERACADDAAAGVRGVVAVENHLDVRDPTVMTFSPHVDARPLSTYRWFEYRPPAPRSTDARILRSFERELRWSPFVSAEQVEATAHDGVLTLTGTVPHEAARHAAIENAYDAGATWVVDDLQLNETAEEGENDGD